VVPRKSVAIIKIPWHGAKFHRPQKTVFIYDQSKSLTDCQ